MKVIAIAIFVFCQTVFMSAESISSFKKAYLNEKSDLVEEKKALESLFEELKEKNMSHQEKLIDETTSLEHEIMESKRKLNSLLEHKTVLKNRSESFSSKDNIYRAAVNKLSAYINENNKKTDSISISDIEYILEKAIDKIDKNSKITVKKASFFDAEGKKVSGKHIDAGNIISFAMSEKSSGIAETNSDGSLSIIMETEKKQVEKLVSGEGFAMLPVFINMKPGQFYAKKNTSFTDTVNKGGVIAWIILFLGLFATMFLLERVIYLKIKAKNPDKVAELLLNERIKGKDAEKMGAFGKVAAAVYKNRKKEREVLEEIAKETILNEIPGLERFFAVSSVVAVTAPLLGLLGTVTGMISTFEVITVFGTGDPKILSGGISEALITTEFGLAVAVPVLIVHSLLSRWSERISDSMERGALFMINKLKD